MADGAESALDEALEENPLAAAGRILAGIRTSPCDDHGRLAAGAYAVRGWDRALAATIDPAFLICRSMLEARSQP